MARIYKYGFNEAKIQRFLSQGRGLGSGKTYKPWFKVHDVPSRGRSHRAYGYKTGREHHFLSDNEHYAFLHFEWNDDVIDIREQYPLRNRMETLAIAAKCGIRHPVDTRTKVPLVMTTDLVVTFVNSQGTYMVAYAIKEAKDLNNKRTLDKLEIERRYWEHRNVPWCILTNDDVKTIFGKNLKWLYHYKNVGDERQRQRDRMVLCSLIEYKSHQPYLPANISCKLIDANYHFRRGDSLASYRRLIATKQIEVDLNKRGLQQLTLNKISFPEVKPCQIVR